MRRVVAKWSFRIGIWVEEFLICEVWIIRLIRIFVVGGWHFDHSLREGIWPILEGNSCISTAGLCCWAVMQTTLVNHKVIRR